MLNVMTLLPVYVSPKDSELFLLLVIRWSLDDNSTFLGEWGRDDMLLKREIFPSPFDVGKSLAEDTTLLSLVSLDLTLS